jgi:hypothetical protein
MGVINSMPAAKWNKENILKAFQDFYALNGRSPITRDATRSNGSLPAQSIVRRFLGSWNNLLIEMGLPLVKDFKDSSIILPCAFCGKEKKHLKCKIKNYSRSFCNSSCCVSYTNKFGKRTCHRRSKLEKYIEQRFLQEFPDLIVCYNDRSVVGSELDIYIPSLKLAFELNGIFHYEPIHGDDCLNRVKNNDNRKFAACIEAKISLCIIDVSSQRNYSDKANERYFTIIKDIVIENLL